MGPVMLRHDAGSVRRSSILVLNALERCSPSTATRFYSGENTEGHLDHVSLALVTTTSSSRRVELSLFGPVPNAFALLLHN